MECVCKLIKERHPWACQLEVWCPRGFSELATYLVVEVVPLVTHLESLRHSIINELLSNLRYHIEPHVGIIAQVRRDGIPNDLLVCKIAICIVLIDAWADTCEVLPVHPHSLDDLSRASRLPKHHRPPSGAS